MAIGLGGSPIATRPVASLRRQYLLSILGRARLLGCHAPGIGGRRSRNLVWREPGGRAQHSHRRRLRLVDVGRVPAGARSDWLGAGGMARGDIFWFRSVPVRAYRPPGIAVGD